MILQPNHYQDDRGTLSFVPIDVLDRHWQNIIISTNPAMHTFRGLHYQFPPQEKYIEVIQGSIMDFAYNLHTCEANMVKLEKGESTFVDDGSAHGFLTLEPNTIVMYLTSEDYSENQKIINWKDVEYIKSYIEKETQGLLIISDKDKNAKGLHHRAR
jgi:dTDP-4-dehydrorhamnose 3,5-epimerase-like enzyme